MSLNDHKALSDIPGGAKSLQMAEWMMHTPQDTPGVSYGGRGQYQL